MNDILDEWFADDGNDDFDIPIKEEENAEEDEIEGKIVNITFLTYFL